jgi:hypothetical protein
VKLKPSGALLIVLLFVLSFFMLCGFAAEKPAHRASPRTEQGTAPVIVTVAPEYEPLAALSHGAERFPRGARLFVLRAGKMEPLLPQFFASADANVGFDAKTVLFAGKKASGDPWQVWELSLDDRSVRQVLAANADLIRPLYLPANRIVYARRTAVGFQIEAAHSDSSGQLPLTHVHANALPVDVLLDGRILFESGFPLGTAGSPELYLVYSDGSGVESYRCDHGAARWGGHQLLSDPYAGDVVFTHGPSLARFTSPLAAEAPVAVPVADYSGALAELPSGAWIVSARTKDRDRFSLMLVRPGAKTLEAVFSDPENNLVEPVLLAPRATPKRHPSGLHDWTTANLLALDVRQSRDGALTGPPATVRLETQDAAGAPVTMGIAPIESDGSFFVKTPADRPIRFAVLDRNGATLRAEQGWFWIRSGEQRICVGCHAGPERAPENRVPQVLLRTTVPADLSGVHSAAEVEGR